MESFLKRNVEKGFLLVVALIATYIIFDSYQEVSHLPVLNGESVPEDELPLSDFSSVSTGRAQAIVNRDLFGKEPESGSQVFVPEDLPETNLNLVLRGIAFSNDSVNSTAMIEAPDGVVQNYAVGSVLPGEATLESILTDRVVLFRRDRRESLFFPALSAGGAGKRSLSDNTHTAAAPAAIRDERVLRNSSRETIAQRDARLRAELAQQRARRTQLSLEERLSQLRGND